TGRQSVMEVLHSIFMRFPEQVIGAHAETFFLPMVVQLVNDESSHCREMLNNLLQQLVRIASKADSILNMLGQIVFSWFHVDSPFLEAAVQVAGIFFDALSSEHGFIALRNKLAMHLVQSARHLLQSALCT